jgi:hypothetical protein
MPRIGFGSALWPGLQSWPLACKDEVVGSTRPPRSSDDEAATKKARQKLFSIGKIDSQSIILRLHNSPPIMPADAGLILGAISVIGLAGLFSTCVELLDQIHTGKRVGETGSRLQIRWSATIYLLEEWGRRFGITEEGSPNLHVHKTLSNKGSIEIVFSLLASLETLFADHKRLAHRYGLCVIFSSENFDYQAELQDLSRQLQDASIVVKKKAKWYRKAKWGISDKEKFETLVSELESIVDKLYRVVPPEVDGSLLDLIEELKERTSKLVMP